MKNIVKQIIDFYYKNFTAPELKDLKIEDKNLLERKWSIFVTLFLDGLVIWSSWNIQPIEDNIVLELIKNTIEALNDSRFEKPKLQDKDKIEIRVDEIIDRWKPLPDWAIKTIDPTKNWLIVIKTDYEKLAVILPNISGTLISGEDFYPVLSKKLDEEFKDENYIVYKITTKVYK